MQSEAAPAEVVHAYLDDDERTIIVRERRGGKVEQRTVRAEHVTWHRSDDIGPEGKRQLKSLPGVRSLADRDGWVRIGWRDAWARRDGLRGMRSERVESFEGDVDPVLLWLVESRVVMGKPRRAYLDLEADSSVPLSQKEEMRILSWAVVDHDTGEEHVGVLRSDDDAAERELLEGLLRVLEDFDQISVWEGDWKGGEFDSVVLPARWRHVGLDVDERRWALVNQLAVWKKMNMHSAESGAEKESFALDNIAHEQIGEGKEPMPAFVVERFGAEKTARGLGAMTRELWDAGGPFRELLARYNLRDTVILRKLELRKQYLMIFQATCRVCGIPSVTKSLQPTRQMDAFMLRLGRERGVRFPTKEWRETIVEDPGAEAEADPGKYRGAAVFHPKSVSSAKDGWTDDDARRWRAANGFPTGVLTDVHVCDFAGMYPSIMLTWNLGAEAKAGRATDPSELDPDTCLSPGTGLVTRTDVVAMVTLALRVLISERKVYGDKAASLPPGTPEWQDAFAISTAFKVIANSFYGAGGSEHSRFNDRDVSESTTQNGVHLLKLTAAEAERRSMIVVYGDSVTGDRVIVTRDPHGRVTMSTAEDLWSEAVKGEIDGRGKEIGSLPGWTALTPSGWKPIRQILRHRSGKPTWRITTKHGQTHVTTDHGIMVRGEETTPADFVTRAERFDVVEAPSEEPTEEIDLLDYLVGRSWDRKVLRGGGRRWFEPDHDDPTMLVLVGGAKVANPVKVRRFYDRGSPEMSALVRLVGAYVSDGSASILGVTTDSRFMLSFCKANLDLQTQLADDLRTIAPGLVVFGPFWTETVWVVRSGTATMACLFDGLCGSGSKNKRLPSFAFTLDDDAWSEMRGALEKGDGWVDGAGQLVFSTTSQRLAAGVSYMLSQRGISHAFSFRESKGAWIIRTRKNAERPRRYSIKSEIFDPSPDEWVYDLSVENEHVFVDGIGRVLLHNTDSCMVHGPTIEAFDRFTGWLNKKRFPDEVKKYGCKENHIKIAFEKSYDRIVLVASKRYVARYSHYKGTTTCNRCRTPKGQPGAVDVRTLTCRDCGHVYDRIPKFLGKPEIKGLEWKRGDKGKLARELQGRIIDVVVGGVTLKDAAGKDVHINADLARCGGCRRFGRAGDAPCACGGAWAPAETPVESLDDCVLACRDAVERSQVHVLQDELPIEEVRWSKGLSKSLREYGKDASEVHVRVARQLVDRGQHVARGMRIEYVVVDGGESPQRAIPAADYSGEFDRIFLWERVYSPAQNFLEKAFPDEDWATYADAVKRPRKDGGHRRGVLPGQLGLNLGTPARQDENDELAVPAYSVKPLVIRVPEDAGLPALDRVLAAAKAHPGPRSIRVLVALRSGGQVVVPTDLRVTPGPRLHEDVALAIEGKVAPSRRS